MAFELSPKVIQDGKPHNPRPAWNMPWGKIEKRFDSYILRLGKVVLKEFDLREGDRVFLHFDAETLRLGVEKHCDGNFVLRGRGDGYEASSVKLSMTQFYRKYLAQYDHLVFPLKARCLHGREGEVVTFTMAFPKKRGRKPETKPQTKPRRPTFHERTKWLRD